MNRLAIPLRLDMKRLGFAILLAMSAESEAATVTVENYGGFVASFALKGCGKELNAGDIPVLQFRTLVLEEFNCSKDQSVKLEIYYYWWGWRTLDFPSIKELRWVGDRVWRVVDGKKKLATLGDISIRLDGFAWAPTAPDNDYFDPKKILHRANLPGADLADADLSKADLIGANLSGANLSRADLRKADLINADLSKADLSGADLYGADLDGANLLWAKNANLYGAITTYSTACPHGSRGPCRPVEYQ
ncbi:MAG: pentapeptide repeat-containing protein [Pseudomonadota bacterium]